uniref:Respiratory burst oxidase n=1 Tax=Rhizophora mucronata TaxID=61149 RepID=A0A2P2NXP1_RHIMU
MQVKRSGSSWSNFLGVNP